MSKLPLQLRLFVLIASLVWAAGSSPAQTSPLLATNNVVLNLNTLGLQPQNITRVSLRSIGPVSTPATLYTPFYGVWSIASYPALTNGAIVFTNLVYGEGVNYQVTLSDFWQTVITNFCIPATDTTNSQGFVSANQRIGYFNPILNQFVWSTPVISNYNITIGGGSATNALTNAVASGGATVTVSNNTATISADAAGAAGLVQTNTLILTLTNSPFITIGSTATNVNNGQTNIVVQFNPTSAIVTNGPAIRGTVKLAHGTNQVACPFVQYTSSFILTYQSQDGTGSGLTCRTNEILPLTSFTIRSFNSNDTNLVNWFLIP